MGISEQEDDRKIYNPFLFRYQYAFFKRYDDSIREPIIDVAAAIAICLTLSLKTAGKTFTE
ncbi:MAG: hypothetical protein QW083_02025 [Methanomassiliicoccales archaeon]